MLAPSKLPIQPIRQRLAPIWVRPELAPPPPRVPVGVSSARMIKAIVDQAMIDADPAMAADLVLIRAHAEHLEAAIIRLSAPGGRR